MNTKWLKWALKKYAPDILTGMAMAGTAVTGWLGVRSGRMIEKEIEQHAKHTPIFADNVACGTIVEGIGKKEELSMTWKYYIPPAASAILTSACIVGAHAAHLHNEAVLASIAALYSGKYQQLVNSAKKALTPEEYGLVQESVTADDMKDLPPWMPQPKEGETLYYEPVSEQYFCATPQAMLYAQLHINKTLQEYWGVTINDYLNVLPGCHRIPEGNQIGWYMGTDEWQELWNELSYEGSFIDIEFIDAHDECGAKRLWYNVQPAPPDEDWEPFK